MVDRRCRESEGKAKIEGYMSVSDEEAHQRIAKEFRIITTSIVVRASKNILPENACEWESDLGICSLVGTIFVCISGKGVKTKCLWHVFNSPLGVVGLNAMNPSLL